MLGTRSDTNAEWARRAQGVLVGPASNLAPPLPIPPIVAARTEGHRIYDVEGRDYIDLPLTMGPLIFGHGYAPWVAAVQAQMAKRGYRPGEARRNGYQ